MATLHVRVRILITAGQSATIHTTSRSGLWIESTFKAEAYACEHIAWLEDRWLETALWQQFGATIAGKIVSLQLWSLLNLEQVFSCGAWNEGDEMAVGEAEQSAIPRAEVIQDFQMQLGWKRYQLGSRTIAA